MTQTRGAEPQPCANVSRAGLRPRARPDPGAAARPGRHAGGGGSHGRARALTSRSRPRPPPSGRTACRARAARSPQRPVCTGDTCRLLLRRHQASRTARGWTRWRSSGPAASPPSQMAGMLRRRRTERSCGSAFGARRREPGLVERHLRAQVTRGLARDDHPRVDELAPLDARHQPHDGVVIRVQGRGHGVPPRRRRAARRAGAGNTGRSASRCAAASGNGESWRSQASGMVSTMACRRSGPAAPAAWRRPRPAPRRTAAARGPGISANDFTAVTSGSPHWCWKYSDAPWSISHRRPVPHQQVGVARRAVDVGDEARRTTRRATRGRRRAGPTAGRR